MSERRSLSLIVRRTAWALLSTAVFPAVDAGGIHRSHSTLKASYDYIVAGGGLSGLVVANRLSESPNTTVLIVEYGDFDDTWNTAMPYYANGAQDASLLFAYSSVPQRFLNNRVSSLGLGATVGGGSTVNGMACTRGQKQDYDAWADLGNPGWGWDGLLPYFQKAGCRHLPTLSSTLNIPSDEVVAKYNYTWSTDSYGKGPFQTSYPPFQWPDVYMFRDGWIKDLGLQARNDGGTNGEIVGVSWRPLSADPRNGTRSSARKAYYDPAANRTNLDILVNNYVAKVNFDNNKKAASVNIIARTGAPITISINKEVVLAAGAIHTPQILQLSGVGSAGLLNRFNITVVKNLPGVGANFQDHPTAPISARYDKPLPVSRQSLANNATFFDASMAEWHANRTGAMTVAHTNVRVILPLQNVTTDPASAIALIDPGANLTSILPSFYATEPTLLAGYKAQLTLLRDMIAGGAGVLEFTWSLGGGGSVIDKPLSRGSVQVSSTDPNPARGPLIDFGSMAHPFDMKQAVLAIKMMRRLYATPSVRALEPVELLPGPAVATDEQIESSLRASVIRSSNAHPVGTAAMMPENLGGVVDSELRVYGVKGVRVVDASLLPLVPVAHTQVTMYAVAEKAADIIRGVEGGKGKGKGKGKRR
ncbi:hypothetical protein OQA88_713 [Cercophora sp. LCS_1]